MTIFFMVVSYSLVALIMFYSAHAWYHYFSHAHHQP